MAGNSKISSVNSETFKNDDTLFSKNNIKNVPNKKFNVFDNFASSKETVTIESPKFK